MSTPTVSNQNLRTAAILKVLGIYLVSLILLIFIFLSNTNIADQQPGNLEEENETLSGKVDQLSEMIYYLDTLSGLSGKLVKLYLKRAADPAAVEVAIDDIRADIPEFSQKLAQVKPQSEDIIKNEQSIKEVYTQLIADRHNIDSLLTLIDKLKRTSQDNIDSKVEQIQSQTSAQASSDQDQISGLEDEVERLKNELERKTNALDRAASDINGKNARINKLGEDLNKVLADIKIIRTGIEGEVNSGKPYRKEEKVTTLYTNVNNLVVYLESALQKKE